MNFLRQSTAVDIALGPFVDSADGVSAETSLTISQADVRLKKNGGAWAQKNDTNAATHEENGWYEVALNSTDTDTVGVLMVSVSESGALPVWREFQVVEEAVYDMLCASSALGYIANAPVNVAQFGGSNGTFSSGRPEVNTTHWGGTAVASAVVPANTIQISGDSTAADNLETALDDTAGPVSWLGIVDQGTAQSATATTLVLRAATPFGANDVPIGMTLAVLGSDQGYWQTRVITDYVTASDTATVATWTVTPSGTITYKIFATAPASSSGGGATAQEVWEYSTRELTANPGLDAAGVRTAVGLASANLDTQLGDLPTAAENATAVWGAGSRTITALDEDSATLDLDATIRAAVGLASANLDTQLGDLPTNGELTTALAAADDAVLAAIAALNNLSKAEVNAEVVDALNTDTYAEPGQGAPGATITLAAKIGYLYKAWRNRSTQTASEYALYADDGTTKDQEASVSDNGTTLDRGEVTTGA